MDLADGLSIEVAYGDRARQQVVTLRLPGAARVSDAVAAAHPVLVVAFPDTDFARLALAIWGETVTSDTPLSTGDRVELLRPLRADPKLARRSRVDANARRKPPGSIFRR
ncbi:MAG: RnfH family protein [Gammaproteobacteria bacterium]